jgi:putative peptidoglycan binding protein
MTLWQMADSVTVGDLPDGEDAYAGYVSGNFTNVAAIASRFPGKPVLGIAPHADHDADCLDIEKGCAAPSDAAAWVQRQLARGIKPVLYCSQSGMPAVLAALSAAGIARSQVWLWTAHYNWQLGKHVCSPSACGAQGYTADATQWGNADMVHGHWDASLIPSEVFSTVGAASVAPPIVAPVSAAPGGSNVASPAPATLKQGSQGQTVRNWQGLLCAMGRTVKIDGSFGADTTAKTINWQKAAGLTGDGVVGPKTWGRALGVSFFGA